MDLRSGHPYWLLKNGLLGTYPSLRNNATCEVAIIGAGITGALTAYRLAQEGVDTVVLDKRDVATGSTAASTALLQHAADTELEDLISIVGEHAAVRSYRTGLEAVDKIEKVVRELRDDCGFARKQSLYLASTKEHVEKLRHEYDCRRRHGFDVALLEKSDVEQRFSFTAPAAMMTTGDGQVDAFRLTHLLFQHAVGRGLRLYDRTDVCDVSSHHKGAVLTTDRGCTISARRVVFATGYESQRYLRRNIGDLHSTFALITEPIEKESFPLWPDRCLIWESARPYCYLRATDDDRILIGGKDVPFATAHRQDSLVKKKTAQLVRRLHRMFPTVQTDVAYAWAGTFGTTADGLAYVGRSREVPHAYFALGYGGNGITMSVTAAELIVDDYLGRPNDDARIFSFDRRKAAR